MIKRKIAIIGAGGRDFHNFLVKYKDDSNYDVKFFTAAQIPGIEKRAFPRSIAGKNYEQDIPIFLENELEQRIVEFDVKEVVFSYSDLSHEQVMHIASRAIAVGASFTMLGPIDTMIKSSKKVISVCAVRTGCGKSPVSRKIGEILVSAGKKVVAVRHPMPYGDIAQEAVQRFAEVKDLENEKCTIEEREEYEPWITLGIPIYAGVDYRAILARAEEEAEIIIWDGGNNDLPFLKPDLHIVVTDPHRAGHEVKYHPGEANFRMADVIIINKIDSAKKADIDLILNHAKSLNPTATIIKTTSPIKVSESTLLKKGKRALVIEDGPTLTHGGMSFGAGIIVANHYDLKIIKPERYAIGSLKEIYKKFPHVNEVLPAMGYSVQQIAELEKTIARIPCDVVIDATPVRLERIISISKPLVHVNYTVNEKGKTLKKVLEEHALI